MGQRALKRAAGRALTVTKIEALRPRSRRYEVTDSVARGLQIRVEPNGRKVWLHRYSWMDEAVRLTLDEYERLPLLDARAWVNDNHEYLRKGIDPRTARAPRRKGAALVPAARLLPAPSSARTKAGKRSGADETIEVLPPGWPTDTQSLKLLRALTPLPAETRYSVEFLIYEFFSLFVAPGRKDRAYVARVLRAEALQHWKDRDARTITTREVIERLDTIVSRGARVMANRVAAILHQLFLHGVHRATLTSSPVQLLFPPGGKESPRTRALSDEEIGRFLAHRFQACPTERLARALTILLLTAVRRIELCLAKWEHIDLVKRIWLVPTEHTKSKRAFLVALTHRLVEEFKALKRLSLGSIYVLPGKNLDQPIAPSSITQSTRDSLWRFKLFGIDPFTPHDFRRSCRTGMSRIGVRRFVARRVLNHKQRGVDGVYDLHEYFQQKRRALRRWTNHCVALESAAMQPPQVVHISCSAPTVGNGGSLRQRQIHRLRREELHALVWSGPMRFLCKRFEISNVWLAKICRRNRIPVPPRGYWAKHQAGIPVEPMTLPPGAPDLPELIEIRGKDFLREERPLLTSTPSANEANSPDERRAA
jgi:integrase